MKLNIGCGRNILEGWVNIDRCLGPGVDLVINLDAPYMAIGLDNTVDEFLLSHVLEHIHKPLPLMEELHRVAKPGAIATIRTPYGSSDDAWEDPTHVRPYFITSFGYFGQPNYWQADYGYRGDWQVKKITLIAPSPPDYKGQMLLHWLNTYRNVVTEMVAELEAVKPIREPKKELQEALVIQMMVSQ